MDISEDYIRMCDCEEVQGQWVIQKTDIVTDREYEEGIYCILTNEDMEDTVENPGYLIWLPRQDQIQEMLNYTLGMLTTWDFYEFCYNKMGLRMSNANVCNFTTMEQLWLAFYMYKKHTKNWNGKMWITK